MPSVKKQLSKNRIKLTITVPAEEMTKNFGKKYDELAPGVTLPGFRPGRGPRVMTIEAIGQQRLAQGALELALGAHYEASLREHGVYPVTAPAVSIAKYPSYERDTAKDELVFEVEFDILPEAKVGNWRKIKVKKIDPKALEVNSDEVEKVVDYLRRQASELKEITRETRQGDWLQVSYTGKIDNVVKESLTSKGMPLVLGETRLIPGFSEALVGMKKGQQKEVELTLPKDLPDKSLAGQKARFEVTLDDHKEVILPTLDNKFFERFGRKSAGELKKSIRASLEAEKRERERRAQEGQISEQIVKMTKVEIPDSLVEQEKKRLKVALEKDLKSRGATLEKYFESLKVTQDKAERDLAEQAQRNIILGVGLGEIAKTEGLKLSAQEGTRAVFDKIIDSCAR